MKLSALLVLWAGVLSAGPSLCQEASHPDTPPGVTVLNVKLETFVTTGIPTSGLPANVSTNPNGLLLPTQSVANPPPQTRMYVYSMELNNEGLKAIKALAWDFIFTDAANKTEMLRHSLANLHQINLHQKKTLRFTTQASPPKTVSASGLSNGRQTTFDMSVRIKCLLFTDGSSWEQTNSDDACKSLLRWIELRKKHPAGLEDLPLRN
jgi:hypothetical protein